MDGPPNNLSKQPEKGILKKSGGIYGPVGGGGSSGSGHGTPMTLPLGMAAMSKGEKWSEDSQSDNQEVMSVLMSPDGARSDRMAQSSLSDVERTLKSLNGYHEDILQVNDPRHPLIATNVHSSHWQSHALHLRPEFGRPICQLPFRVFRSSDCPSSLFFFSLLKVQVGRSWWLG